MNEVSIIINGVRYDVVDVNGKALCNECDLNDWCKDYDFCFFCSMYCKKSQYFKKSDKKFEV